MNNKYFTPDLEDLFIGYETTIFTPSEFEQPYYKDIILSKNDLIEIFTFNGDLRNGQGIPLDFLKTSYLTKEDIEKGGWENTYKNFSDFYFEKENYRLLYDFNALDLKVFKNIISEVIFDGKIKCVNEFRKLIKMLEI